MVTTTELSNRIGKQGYYYPLSDRNEIAFGVEVLDAKMSYGRVILLIKPLGPFGRGSKWIAEESGFNYL